MAQPFIWVIARLRNAWLLNKTYIVDAASMRDLKTKTMRIMKVANRLVSRRIDLNVK